MKAVGRMPQTSRTRRTDAKHALALTSGTGWSWCCSKCLSEQAWRGGVPMPLWAVRSRQFGSALGGQPPGARNDLETIEYPAKKAIRIVIAR